MGLIKKILKYIIILVIIILYITSSVIFSKKYFIVFTIILISLLLWKIYKKIKKFNDLNNINKADNELDTSNKKSKILVCISIIINLISIVIVLLFSYSVITYEGDLSMDFWEMGLLVEIEKDDYYYKMDEKKYDNIRIIYNKDIESILPFIEKYIEQVNVKSNTLLGLKTSHKLTIQIDYDEDVFLMRNIVFGGVTNDNIAGHYYEKSNTIYVYTNNPVRDVLMNMPHTNITGGIISISDSSFKDTLFHEYAHYAIDSFLKENNIENTLVPSWFKEGIAEYISGKTVYLDTPLEYISIKKLESSEDWDKEIENNKGNIYEQSKLAVLKIVDEKGEKVLRDMILSCKDKDFETIVKEYMNCSFEEFENNLEIDIKEGKFENRIESNEGNLYIDTKRKCLEEYIKYNENDIEAYEFLGSLYENKEESLKVIDLFKYATEKNPEEYVLWHRLGLAYENIGEDVLSKESFDKANLLKNDKIN